MSRRNFLPGDRALHDDAIIEARYKLAEKQSTLSAQYATDLVLDCLAREGRIEAFETNSRGFFRPERIDAEFFAKSFRHCHDAIFLHEVDGVLFLLRVLLQRLDVRTAPAA